jgi:cytochrome oxidase Cu insertion factor (SCO1/SenC/PrrC family)
MTTKSSKSSKSTKSTKSTNSGRTARSRPSRPSGTAARGARPGPAGARRGRGLLVAVVVAMTGALLLAVAVTVATGGGGDDTATSDFDTRTAAVDTGGGALPALPDAGDDPAVGQAAPRVEGVDRDGGAVTLPATGRPTILVFLAHWCPHCQREVPLLQGWIDEGQLPGGVDVAAVATGFDPARPNYPASAWLDREGWTPPTVADADGSAAAAYGLTSFPFWVAVDAGGTVVERRTGELTLQEVTDMAIGARDAAPA